ncbi:GLPGLI family protein [uncultured Formosa sp.]|uniref:GLPGLI family protein n=1 Tax=uncultured Formosa sp. TaxID=255435 RepID=UPI0026059F61|nr:GLPGLI family protein [uncultured Formosa sp.]
MKNISLLIFFLIVSLPLTAQPDAVYTSVNYHTKLNLDYPAEQYYTLVFKGNRSSYIEKEYIAVPIPNSKTVDYTNHEESEIFYVNNVEKTLHFQEYIDSKKYLVTANFPKIKWDITSTVTDTVLGHLCNKAVGNFRGRTYTAWYTPEIPVPFGPWKLQGLPGLILKVTDSLNQIDITATRLEFKTLKTLDEKLDLPTDYKKIIDEKTFLDMRFASRMEQIQRIRATMSREAKLGPINIKTDRTNRWEKFYEWETEPSTPSKSE